MLSPSMLAIHRPFYLVNQWCRNHLIFVVGPSCAFFLYNSVIARFVALAGVHCRCRCCVGFCPRIIAVGANRVIGKGGGSGRKAGLDPRLINDLRSLLLFGSVGFSKTALITVNFLMNERDGIRRRRRRRRWWWWMRRRLSHVADEGHIMAKGLTRS